MYKTLVTLYRWVVAMTLLTIAGLIAAVILILSFGALRGIVARHIIAPSSVVIMRTMGFKGVFPDRSAYPKEQVFYTFNHNAYLDVFLLTGLALPNTRFLLSEKTWFYLPVTLAAWVIGTFYIPTKNFPKRRARFFERTTQKLHRNKYSFAGSSEGVHEHFHGIAPFNQGVYRMAMEAGLPVVCLYIHIPEENNMFTNTYAKNGTLEVEVMATVPTEGWTEDNLEERIAYVRSLYVNRFNELNPNHHQV